MVWFVRWLLGRHQHLHDYQLVFDNPRRPLEYRLLCSCGSEAPDMAEALRRMQR